MPMMLLVVSVNGNICFVKLTRAGFFSLPSDSLNDEINNALFIQIKHVHLKVLLLHKREKRTDSEQGTNNEQEKTRLFESAQQLRSGSGTPHINHEKREAVRNPKTAISTRKENNTPGKLLEESV